MGSKGWYRSTAALMLAAVALPPGGIVLLWMRAGAGILKKILGSLLLVVWTVAALVLFFGLRVELDGGATRLLFKFYRPEKHYAELERSRQRQKPQPAAADAAALKEAPQNALAAGAVRSDHAGQVVGPTLGERAETKSAYWTDFRGPNRDGRYDEMPVRTDWPAEGMRPLWRQPIGGGYASFVVANGQAFTIEQRRGQEVVTAYEVTSGRELWAHGWDAEFQETLGGDGPRACPTWHEGRIYALGAAGELRCLDAATGERMWSRNILTDNGAQNPRWAMSAAPLVVDGKVIVLPGGPGGKSVVAYDSRTGDPVWKTLDDGQAYTSPMLVTLAGKRQLLVVSARRMMGLTVEDGSLLWEYLWVTQMDISVAQPLVIGENRVFVSAGYGHGAALIEITPADKAFQVRTVWTNNRMKNKFSSSVLYEGNIYGLDEAILACISAETGELKWKGGRYGYGQVLLASGQLIVTTESGGVVVVKATPEAHHEVARFPAISGKTWNVPALAGGYLLVRNATEMACFRVAAR